VSIAVLSWFLFTVVLLVGIGVIAVLDDTRSGPLPRPPVHRDVPVSMQLVFVEPSESDVVLDGVLGVDDDAPGVPVTMRLEQPVDLLLRSTVDAALQRWADEGADVHVDLSRIDEPHASIAMSHDDVMVRLAFAGPVRAPDDD
jgi:hypothetical protein